MNTPDPHPPQSAVSAGAPAGPRVPLLVLAPLRPEHQQQVAAAHELLYAPTEALRRQRIATDGSRVRAVLTIGTLGLTAQEMQAMPALELVCALGAGYERIDVAAARERGITLANGAGTNDACVADHAFALLLAAVRRIPWLDRGVRQGLWRDQLDRDPPTVSGRRLGVLGLGHIGRSIARRALGFDMAVGYCSRAPKADVPYAFHASPTALARWCDCLVVATPGGPETVHLVGAQVIDALGPEGVLVNIARGSVVDTRALADALRHGRLAAAGLDVYESEPQPPAELTGLDNVVLTPHVAGRSPQSVQATVDHFLANVSAHFSGKPVLTPI